MDRHRISPLLPVRFPALGRDGEKLPLLTVPADFSISNRSRIVTLSTLSSLALALAAQLVGQERFHALRFSAAFAIAALADLLLGRRATISHPKGTRS